MKTMLMAFMLLFVSAFSVAQQVTGLVTKFSDTFRDWEVYTTDPDIRGELRMRWYMQNDWTVWDMSYGDINATIEQKWEEDPGFWVIRCNGKTVNAKTIWRGDFSRWKLSDGDQQINWRAKYSNQKDEWELDTRDPKFFMFTQWRGDPREWVVVDDLGEDTSDAMKVAMIFLAIHFSTPRI